MAVYIIEIAGH